MPRIRCHYDDCAFLKDGYCGAIAIDFDPDAGCLTYTLTEISVVDDSDDWDDLLDDVEPLYEEDDQLLSDWDDDGDL